MSKDITNIADNAFLFSLSSDPLRGTNIDVGFAISATSPDASTTIRLMQNSIKSIIDTYGATNLRYGVMTFADRPIVLTRFAEKQSPEDLKKIVVTATPSSGKPSLENMLPEAKKLFEEAGARPDAKKFLVVILDNKSANERDDVIKAAKPLTDTGLWVIPVAIGDNADDEELQLITPLKRTTVEVPNTGDPEKLAEEITDKVKKRKCYHIAAKCMFAFDSPMLAMTLTALMSSNMLFSFSNNPTNQN